MPNAPKTPQRTIRIPDDLWQAVQFTAQAQRRDVSWVVRESLEKYLGENVRPRLVAATHRGRRVAVDPASAIPSGDGWFELHAYAWDPRRESFKKQRTIVVVSAKELDAIHAVWDARRVARREWLARLGRRVTAAEVDGAQGVQLRPSERWQGKVDKYQYEEPVPLTAAEALYEEQLAQAAEPQSEPQDAHP